MNRVRKQCSTFLRLLAPAVLLVQCTSICARSDDGAAWFDEEPFTVSDEPSLIRAGSEDFSPLWCPKFADPAPTNWATDPGCHTDPCPQLIAGLDATFFRASASGIGVGTSVTNLAGPTSPSLGVSSDETFETYSPRIFAGVQDDCWAILGRFWYLSDSTNEFEPFLPPPGSGVGSSAFERLRAYTVDLELSRAICLGTSKVNLFLGGRYASFETGEGLEITRLTNANEIVYTSTTSSFSFNGLGVTTGFLGVTPIGRDTRFNLLWGVRGSVLWGAAERGVQTMATFVDVSSGSSVNSADEQNHETAFILEALLGVEWNHQLRRLPMSAFLRIAAEYQYWDLGDNGQAASTSLAVSSSNAAASKGLVGDVNAQFIGFTIGAGFTW